MLTRRALLVGTGGFAMALGLAACMGSKPSGVPKGSDRSDDPVDHPGAAIHSVRYWCGGGEYGDSDSIELSRGARGVVMAVRKRKESWSDKGKKTTVKLDETAFDELARIAEEYDLRGASEQPERDEQALDAATTSVSFAYLDEEGNMDVDGMFTVSETQDLTDRQREGFWAACDALLALVA